jgi:hypothetical protein
VTDSRILRRPPGKRWRVGLAVTLVALTASLGVVAVDAPPAKAGASGCSFWNPFTVGGYRLAAGTYCVTLAGTRTYVDYVYGGFSSAGNVCNWNVTAEFFDTSGRWYMTRSSPIKHGCTPRNGAAVTLKRYVKRGFMCSTLKQNGGRITSVCHNIH